MVQFVDKKHGNTLEAGDIVKVMEKQSYGDVWYTHFILVMSCDTVGADAFVEFHDFKFNPDNYGDRYSLTTRVLSVGHDFWQGMSLAEADDVRIQFIKGWTLAKQAHLTAEVEHHKAAIVENEYQIVADKVGPALMQEQMAEQFNAFLTSLIDPDGNGEA